LIEYQTGLGQEWKDGIRGTVGQEKRADGVTTKRGGSKEGKNFQQ